MCTVPKIKEMPKTPQSPPPPEETADVFSSIKDEEDKLLSNKKKKGMSILKTQNNSPLKIPLNNSLNIPK